MTEVSEVSEEAEGGEDVEELDLDEGWREPSFEPAVIVNIPDNPPETSPDAFAIQSLEEFSEELADPGWTEELGGKTFGGRFRLNKEIARGGMGVVYSGVQTNLDRRVVVKVISKAFVDGPEDIARFKLEARGLSKLQHPNIVTIHDFGSEDGLSYIAMEHIEGETLKDLMDRHRALSMPEFVRIAHQILQAFGAAHERGIIHRDIKPANVMLTRRNHQDDFVKVVDFGLVKLADSTEDITGKGLVGTFAYVSPEQILGEPFDARSDVYSLGVLFYHMLSGKKPFDDPDGMAVLYKHVNEEPPPLASVLPEPGAVPQRLIEVIHRCLAKDPSRRPLNANDLLAILIEKGIILGEDSSGPTRASQYHAWFPVDHAGATNVARRWAIGAVVVSGLLTIGLLILAPPRLERKPPAVEVVAADAPTPEAPMLGAASAAASDATRSAWSIAAEAVWVDAGRQTGAEVALQAYAVSDLSTASKASPEVVPKPASKPKKASPATAARTPKEVTPPEKTTESSVGSPRLPSTVRLQDRRALERMLRRVEGEVVDRNNFSPVQVQNVTQHLFKAVDADLRASKTPTLSPRTVYYLIAKGLASGKSREQISKQLADKYSAGSLK